MQLGEKNREIRANPEINCGFLRNLYHWNMHLGGTCTWGVPRDREQPSRLLCVKVTERYSFLPLLFQLVHLPSNATLDLS